MCVANTPTKRFADGLLEHCIVVPNEGVSAGVAMLPF